jgi:hypothetical protein
VLQRAGGACLRLPVGDPHGLFVPIVARANATSTAALSYDDLEGERKANALCLPLDHLPSATRIPAGLAPLAEAWGEYATHHGVQPPPAEGAAPSHVLHRPSHCLAWCLSVDGCVAARFTRAVPRADLPEEDYRKSRLVFAEVEASFAQPSSVTRCELLRVPEHEDITIDTLSVHDAPPVDELDRAPPASVEWVITNGALDAIARAVTERNFRVSVDQDARRPTLKGIRGITWMQACAWIPLDVRVTQGSETLLQYGTLLQTAAEAIAGKGLRPAFAASRSMLLSDSCLWDGMVAASFLAPRYRLPSQGLYELGRVHGVSAVAAKRMCLNLAPRCAAVACYRRTCFFRSSLPLVVVPPSGEPEASDEAFLEYVVHPLVLAAFAESKVPPLGDVHIPGPDSLCDSGTSSLLPRTFGLLGTFSSRKNRTVVTAPADERPRDDDTAEDPRSYLGCESDAVMLRRFTRASAQALVQQREFEAKQKRPFAWTLNVAYHMTISECHRFCLSFKMCRSAVVNVMARPGHEDAPRTGPFAVGQCRVECLETSQQGADCTVLIHDPHRLGTRGAQCVDDAKLVEYFIVKRGIMYNRRASFLSATVAVAYDCMRLCVSYERCLGALFLSGHCHLMALPLLHELNANDAAAAQMVEPGLPGQASEADAISMMLSARRNVATKPPDAGDLDPLGNVLAGSGAEETKVARPYDDDDDTTTPAPPPPPAKTAHEAVPANDPMEAPHVAAIVVRSNQDLQFPTVEVDAADLQARIDVNALLRAAVKPKELLAHVAFGVSSRADNFESRLKPQVMGPLQGQRVLISIDEPDQVTPLMRQLRAIMNELVGPYEGLIVACPPPPVADKAVNGNGAWKTVRLAVALARVYPNASWYGLLDDDTYVFKQNLAYLIGPNGFGSFLKRQRPWYIGGGWRYRQSLLRYIDGASGIYLNRRAMKRLVAIAPVCERYGVPLYFGDVRMGVCMFSCRVVPCSVQRSLAA